MKMDRIVLASALALGLSAVACAHDRPQEVKSAETDLANDEQKARQNQANLQQHQMNEHTRASNEGMTRDEHAELDAKQRSQRAEQRNDDQQKISASESNLVGKSASLEQERRDFESKARERLTKADAKANELKTKSAKLPAQKKNEFANNWQKYNLQKSDAGAKVDGLARAPNDTWNGTKSTVETSLDALDDVVDKLGKDL